MKIAFYVVALVGLIALGIGIYWLTKHDHHYRQYVAIAAGAILLIGGLVASFVVKPKKAAVAA